MEVLLELGPCFKYQLQSRDHKMNILNLFRLFTGNDSIHSYQLNEKQIRVMTELSGHKNGYPVPKCFVVR